MTEKGGLLLRWYVIAFIGFLYLPILMIPIFSFNDSAAAALPLKGFTLKWYAALAGNETMHAAAWNSLLVGLVTAVLATILGICGARAFTRYRFAGALPARGLIMAPLVLPEIIVAVALLIVLLGAGFKLSLLTIVLGHIVFCLPYSMSVLISGLEGFDVSLEEASDDLGETPWGTFSRVTLPMMAPAILSSLLVSFTISLDEFMLAFFLGGTSPTLPVYIWGQLRFAGTFPNVLALGTILLGLSVVLLVTAEIFRKRAAARTGNSGGTVA
jgi:spermidine/putrescine transport system permease protein